MTNSEIYREWKQAKDPKNQITIIADMEFRSKVKPVAAAIMEQCEVNDDDVPLYIKRMAGVDISEDLKTLVESGMTRRQIADDLGVSTVTVGNLLKEAQSSQSADADKSGQRRTRSDSEKALASAPPVMTEMVKVIAECAERLGRGEVIVSAYPDGSYSVIWKLEAGYEKV